MNLGLQYFLSFWLPYLVAGIVPHIVWIKDRNKTAIKGWWIVAGIILLVSILLLGLYYLMQG